ncbi:MAG: hypothetical protein Q7O66_16815 [Dehalococcoidia bacterium]|nr:hypothetical protein [Dehalococcoidia bacterium]
MKGGLPTETKTNYPDSAHGDSLQVGAEFLDFVLVTLQPMGMYLQPFTSKKYQYKRGESLQGWEVKYDGRCSGVNGTGRLSIEIAEKVKAENTVWIPSGIYRSDNTWLYIQGNYKVFYIFIKKFLVALHNTDRYEIGESYGTVRKFYLPLVDANRYGYRIDP